MTREQMVLRAISAASGQVAGIQEIVLRVNGIMKQEGERELSVQTIRDMVQSMAAQPKPLLQARNTEITIWGLTKDGKKALKR